MKIQFILSDDIVHNTSANIRNSGLIKGLLQCGHDVHVICLKKSAKQDSGILSRISGAEVSYILRSSDSSNIIQNNQSRSLKRLIVKMYNFIRVYDPNAITIRRLKEDSLRFDSPDVMISSSDPRSAHLLALKIKSVNNYVCPVVQYWGDPMSNDISASLLMRPILKRAEKKLLTKANLILYTNQITCDKICQMYGISREKVRFIPTACEKEISDEPKSDVTNIGYFGEYYSWRRNILPLIEAISLNNNYRLSLAGTTDINNIASRKVTVFPFMDSNELRELQNKMDILVILENKPKRGEEANCIQIPGKVFHYGATNKKILVIEETGLTRRAFGNYDRYKFCKNDTQEINEALAELINDHTPSIVTPVKEFEPKNVASLLINNYLKR